MELFVFRFAVPEEATVFAQISGHVLVCCKSSHPETNYPQPLDLAIVHEQVFPPLIPIQLASKKEARPKQTCIVGHPEAAAPKKVALRTMSVTDWGHWHISFLIPCSSPLIFTNTHTHRDTDTHIHDSDFHATGRQGRRSRT